MSHITLVFKPQLRELHTETTPAAGSITAQISEPAKLEIVSSGFERRLELLPALRGADGKDGAIDWDANVPDDLDPVGIINSTWSI